MTDIKSQDICPKIIRSNKVFEIKMTNGLFKIGIRVE